jgi:thioredoxin 1
VTRHVLGAVVVLAGELYLYLRYASLDGEFHYWLHGLLGWALGLSALTAPRLRRPAPGRAGALSPTPWEAVGVGHLYSAAPDILFLTTGVLHARWMDAFALHITVHFVPAPILTALVVFLLAAGAYALAMSRRRRLAAGGLLAGVAAFAVAVAFAAPIPTSIQDLRADRRLAWHHGEHSGRHHATAARATRNALTESHRPQRSAVLMSNFPILDSQQVAEVTAQPGLVLLDFWQASCAPCRALEPKLAALAEQHPDAFAGYRVDVHSDRQTVEAFDVMSIPTLVLLRDGTEVARLDGLIQPQDLHDLVSAVGTVGER